MLKREHWRDGGGSGGKCTAPYETAATVEQRTAVPLAAVDGALRFSFESLGASSTGVEDVWLATCDERVWRFHPACLLADIVSDSGVKTEDQAAFVAFVNNLDRQRLRRAALFVEEDPLCVRSR